MPDSVVDILLGQPLQLLRAQEDVVWGPGGLQRAYAILQPYYAQHLQVLSLQINLIIPSQTAWPRSFLAKSQEKSSKYRTAGNTMFSKACLRDALRLYTLAVVWAAEGSQELAMALANRSDNISHRIS